MSCGVGHRHDSDPALLWLWLWPATVALMGPLAWEPPHAMGVVLKSKKKKAGRQENREISKCTGIYIKDLQRHRCYKLQMPIRLFLLVLGDKHLLWHSLLVKKN